LGFAHVGGAAEADGVDAGGGQLVEAGGGVDPDGELAVEAATPDRLAIAGGRPLRVDLRLAFVERVPVVGPLPHVAHHVHVAGLGLRPWELPDGRGAGVAVV